MVIEIFIITQWITTPIMMYTKVHIFFNNLQDPVNNIINTVANTNINSVANDTPSISIIQKPYKVQDIVTYFTPNPIVYYTGPVESYILNIDIKFKGDILQTLSLPMDRQGEHSIRLRLNKNIQKRLQRQIYMLIFSLGKNYYCIN